MPPIDKDKKKKRQRLVDVDVTHVSLVDRPANQTPFKFVKRDEGTETEGAFPMNITLKNMFGARPAEVTSVMADTEAKALNVAKSLMGIEEPTAEKQDGVFVVRKSGSKPDATERVVHLGKRAGVAYTIANLQKELVLYDAESQNFDETVQKEGFVPGLYTATEALHTTIRNIAMDENTKSPADFETKVQKALEDFGSYVSSLVGALPEAAFKFEKALAVVAPNDLGAIKPVEGGFNSAVYDMIFGDPDKADAADADADAKDDEGKTAADADADTKDADAQANAGDAKGEGDAGSADADASGKDGDADAQAASGGSADADAAPSNLEELPKGSEGNDGMTQEEVLAGVTEALTKTLGDQIAAAMKPLTERLDKQDEAIQSVTKAMGSTIASTPDEDGDGGNVVDLRNSTPAGDPPLMDTAYRTSKQG